MRVVLADACNLVRAGFKRLLEDGGEHAVVGEAADGQGLLEQVRRHRPDVVLTETSLPGMSGIEALAQLRQLHPDVPVLIVSSRGDGQLIRSALRLGAAGYLDKDGDPVELGLALRAVQKHQIYLSPSISHAAIDRRGSERVEDDVSLTPRQRQVLQMIGQGKSTREIASQMGVSVKTVETHRARMMESLGLQGINALMRYAIRGEREMLLF
ncbi:response regulator transcription factor [Fontimonas sp. SYSU GA230001]|uniref:response regulator transcription factor n=1 Tax=Fontimonas sp. SYSU GA230001 TaxID=3142450 RepID=UPI0032B5F48A